MIVSRRADRIRCASWLSGSTSVVDGVRGGHAGDRQRLSVVDRVEEKLERAVSLPPKADWRPEYRQMPFAQRHVDNRDCPIQMFLATCPAAPQRRWRAEPRHPARV